MGKLTNIKRGNGYAQGGLVAILAFPTFLANGATRSASYTPDATNEKLISTITLDATVVPVILESEIDKANYTANLTVGAGRYIAQALGFTLAGTDAEKTKALEDVDLQLYTYIVKDRRGKYFLLGEENGLIASQNNNGSGSAAGDLNGYEIIVGGSENGRPREVSEAAYATLAALVTP
ncbi:hypothetical protein [Pontibacter mangrovi]|uniref:Uncharacterized protein n=1 Tax=Pontibacter mangrovi TaxID=2589816 RepID=A0A501W5P3_9BACT|nr:hypothetical protein [Pontibacter mangrovi]TPE44929.1 hypothetical protein FJM65_07905 [Pontibacter mangrovi]